jgi:hypothetical protein
LLRPWGSSSTRCTRPRQGLLRWCSSRCSDTEQKRSGRRTIPNARCGTRTCTHTRHSPGTPSAQSLRLARHPHPPGRLPRLQLPLQFPFSPASRAAEPECAGALPPTKRAPPANRNLSFYEKSFGTNASRVRQRSLSLRLSSPTPPQQRPPPSDHPCTTTTTHAHRATTSRVGALVAVQASQSVRVGGGGSRSSRAAHVGSLFACSLRAWQPRRRWQPRPRQERKSTTAPDT